MNPKEMMAPCGIDCYNCDVYHLNLTDDKRQYFAEIFKLKVEDVACMGCLAEQRCKYHPEECATLECAKSKSHDFCFECKDFPCQLLQPCADGAQKFPHNMKVYNLCRASKIGVENFVLNEAKDVRARYYKGKFVIGRGPQI